MQEVRRAHAADVERFVQCSPRPDHAPTTCLCVRGLACSAWAAAGCLAQQRRARCCCWRAHAGSRVPCADGSAAAAPQQGCARAASFVRQPCELHPGSPGARRRHRRRHRRPPARPCWRLRRALAQVGTLTNGGRYATAPAGRRARGRAAEGGARERSSGGFPANHEAAWQRARRAPISGPPPAAVGRLPPSRLLCRSQGFQCNNAASCGGLRAPNSCLIGPGTPRQE